MRYRLILILTTRGDHNGHNMQIHTQAIEPAYSSATDAMNAGNEFIKNIIGHARVNASFSVVPLE